MSATPNASDVPYKGALRRFRAWIVLGVLYATFFLWYTPLGGPLTEEEIGRYEAVLQDLARNDEGLARWRAFTRRRSRIRSIRGSTSATRVSCWRWS